MDESRIPKSVEAILLLDPANPRTLFKRKKKDRSKRMSKLRKSMKKVVSAVTEAQADGAKAVMDQVLSIRKLKI